MICDIVGVSLEVEGFEFDQGQTGKAIDSLANSELLFVAETAASEPRDT